MANVTALEALAVLVERVKHIEQEASRIAAVMERMMDNIKSKQAPSSNA